MSTQTTWTVAEAKAKFSELIEKAKSEGPQEITKHGRTTAVVVAAEQWRQRAERKGSLADFLMSSPLRGSGLKLKRLPFRVRRVNKSFRHHFGIEDSTAATETRAKTTHATLPTTLCRLFIVTTTSHSASVASPAPYQSIWNWTA